MAPGCGKSFGRLKAAQLVDEPLFRVYGGLGHGWQRSNNTLKIRRTFKYRLYPNRRQREALRATLEVCRQLYNDALQERREAWKTAFNEAFEAVAVNGRPVKSLNRPLSCQPPRIREVMPLETQCLPLPKGNSTTAVIWKFFEMSKGKGP